jgi:hypothetical protein
MSELYSFGIGIGILTIGLALLAFMLRPPVRKHRRYRKTSRARDLGRPRWRDRINVRSKHFAMHDDDRQTPI